MRAPQDRVRRTGAALLALPDDAPRIVVAAASVMLERACEAGARRNELEARAALALDDDEYDDVVGSRMSGLLVCASCRLLRRFLDDTGGGDVAPGCRAAPVVLRPLDGTTQHFAAWPGARPDGVSKIALLVGHAAHETVEDNELSPSIAHWVRVDCVILPLADVVAWQRAQATLVAASGIMILFMDLRNDPARYCVLWSTALDAACRARLAELDGLDDAAFAAARAAIADAARVAIDAATADDMLRRRARRHDDDADDAVGVGDDMGDNDIDHIDDVDIDIHACVLAEVPMRSIVVFVTCVCSQDFALPAPPAPFEPDSTIYNQLQVLSDLRFCALKLCSLNTGARAAI